MTEVNIREVKAVESYDLKAHSGFCAESNKVYLTRGQSGKTSQEVVKTDKK